MNIATFTNELKKAVTYDDTEYAKVLLTRFRDEFNHLCIGIFYINNIKLKMSSEMLSTIQPFIKTAANILGFVDFEFKPEPLPKTLKLPKFTKDTKISTLSDADESSYIYEAIIDKTTRDLKADIDKKIFEELTSTKHIKPSIFCKLNTTS